MCLTCRALPFGLLQEPPAPKREPPAAAPAAAARYSRPLPVPAAPGAAGGRPAAGSGRAGAAVGERVRGHMKVRAISSSAMRGWVRC